MKTIEFKLTLSPEERSLFNRWLEILKKVWNRALALLEWKQYYNRLQKCLEIPDSWGFNVKPVQINCRKVGEDWVYYSNIAAEFRIEKSLGWEIPDNIEVRPVVSLVKPHWQEEPLIKGYSAIDIRKPFAQKRYPWIKEQDIPMTLVNDYIGLVVAEAWKRYQQGKADKPKYKGNTDTVKTVKSESFRGQCQADWQGNKVRLPGGCWLKLRKLNQRITPGADISTFNLCKRPSGYYLQLGWVDAPTRTGRNQKITTTKLELNQQTYTTDNHQQSIPQPLLRSLRALEREQQKLSRCKYKSNRSQKQKIRVGKIHEKIKAQRTAWQHWHTTAIADIYNSVEIKLGECAPLDKPDPYLNQDYTGYSPNGASAVADLNKTKSDAALSSFKDKLKGKCSKITEEKASTSTEHTAKTTKAKKRKGSKRKNTQEILVNSQNLDNLIKLEDKDAVSAFSSTGSVSLTELSKKRNPRKGDRKLNRARRSLQDSLEPVASQGV